MLSSELFDKIKCSFQKENVHYLVQPIALQCGHSICKTCIPPASLNSELISIKCGICGDKNKINLKKLSEFEYTKQLIRANFTALFEASVRKSEDYFQSLLGIWMSIVLKLSIEIFQLH